MLQGGRQCGRGCGRLNSSSALSRVLLPASAPVMPWGPRLTATAAMPVRTAELVRTLPAFSLQQPKLLHSPHLNLPAAAVKTLFAARTPTRSLAPELLSGKGLGLESRKTAYSSFQVVLTFEVDGQPLERHTLVDLRFFPGRQSVRVHNHRAFDLLEGRLLTGWKCDADRQLVACLTSLPTSPPVPAAPKPARTRAPRVLRMALVPGLPSDADQPPMNQEALIATLGSTNSPRVAFSRTPQTLQQQLGQAPPAPQPPKPLPSYLMQQSTPTQQQLQLQRWMPAAAMGMAAVNATTEMAGQMIMMTNKMPVLAAAAHGVSHGPRERRRTFVPSRIRPVMSEVYVPFGLWRDLFEGSDRPFPAAGLALRVSITGSVQMPEQQALLVRRVTPYGYYVLRGMKGLKQLKGKLMVRWNLLVNGVVEMELAEGRPPATPPATLAPGSVRHTATPSNNILPGLPRSLQLSQQGNAASSSPRNALSP